MIEYKNTLAARAVRNKYSDILPLSRPEPSHQHPRMSLLNRAKIFSPFAALRGYDEEIAAEGMEQLKVDRIDLCEEDKEKLSIKLGSVRKGMEVTVCYFKADVAASDSLHTDHLHTSTTPVDHHIDHTSNPAKHTAEPKWEEPEDCTGYYRTITGVVERIDPIYQKLCIRAGYKNELGKVLPLVIRFGDILELSGEEIE